MVRSLSDFDRLSSAWGELVSEEDAPFSGFAWNRSWLRAYRDTIDELLVFLAVHDQEVVAILPAFRRGKSIRLVGDNVGDYQDVISKDPAVIDSFLEMVFRHARDRRLSLRFAKISSRGRLAASLPLVGARSGFLPDTRLVGPSPYFILPDDSTQLFQRFSAHSRSQLRRKLKRIRKEWPDLNQCLFSGSEITSEILDEIARLHIRNQDRKKGGSVFALDEFRQFLAQLTSEESADAGFQIAVLRGGGSILAMIAGFSRGGRFYYWIAAYEGAHSWFSPGKCNLLLLFERLIESGHREFDFLCGGELYKFQYADLEYEIREWDFLFPSIENRVRLFCLQLGRKFRYHLKILLIKSGLYRPKFRIDPVPVSR